MQASVVVACRLSSCSLWSLECGLMELWYMDLFVTWCVESSWSMHVPCMGRRFSTTEPPGKSPLVYFCFVFINSKISSPRPMQRRFSSAFSSRSFMGLGLTFKSLIRINFCGWCKIGVQYHSCTCVYPVFYHHLLKKLSFPHFVFLVPFQRVVDCKCVGIFLDSIFYCIGLCFCLYACTILF